MNCYSGLLNSECLIKPLALKVTGSEKHFVLESIYGKKAQTLNSEMGGFCGFLAPCLFAGFSINRPQRKSGSYSLLRPRVHRGVAILFIIKESICQHDLIK